MVLTGVVQNLFHHVRVVQLFQDGNLLVHPLQGPFELRGTLRVCLGSARGGSPCPRRERERETQCACAFGTDERRTGRLNHLPPAPDLRGKPACLISRFLDNTFIAYRGKTGDGLRQRGGGSGQENQRKYLKERWTKGRRKTTQQSEARLT
uniref:Uncharacterized protein n=1 Tax=Gasterosteus aculeatus aculeatus TaxID=481459 RepID=A0AAQ4S3T5_GASAC